MYLHTTRNFSDYVCYSRIKKGKKYTRGKIEAEEDNDDATQDSDDGAAEPMDQDGDACEECRE